MRCPKCGTEAPDDAWNCASCRMNLYWAAQHYDDLARIREHAGLPESADSPTFLVHSHETAMSERGEPAENNVRSLARKVMRRKSAPIAADDASVADRA